MSADSTSEMYDPLDRRIGTSSGFTSTWFGYDGDQVMSAHQGYTITDRFTTGGIDDVVGQEKNGALRWLLTDGRGSVTGTTSSGGSSTGSKTYGTFGGTQSSSGTTDSFFAYTGREWDDAAGLQYSRNRWYDPSAKRWLSEDPIGFGGGDANLSRYVGNSPGSFSDPSGLIGTPLNPDGGGADDPVDYDNQDRVKGKLYKELDELALLEGRKGLTQSQQNRRADIVGILRLIEAGRVAVTKGDDLVGMGSEGANQLAAFYDSLIHLNVTSEEAFFNTLGKAGRYIRLTVQMTAGVVSTGIGALATAGGNPLGLGGIAAGLDVIRATYNEWVTGEPQQTVAEQAVRKTVTTVGTGIGYTQAESERFADELMMATGVYGIYSIAKSGIRKLFGSGTKASKNGLSLPDRGTGGKTSGLLRTPDGNIEQLFISGIE